MLYYYYDFDLFVTDKKYMMMTMTIGILKMAMMTIMNNNEHFDLKWISFIGNNNNNNMIGVSMIKCVLRVFSFKVEMIDC